MDFSKFKTSDWLKVGGAIGFLIFGFMEWVTIEIAGTDLGGGGNVFDFFFTGTIPWILVIGSGVVTVLLVQGVLKRDQLPWPLIMLFATCLAAILLLLRVLINPIDGKDALEAGGASVGRGIGMLLSFVAGVVAAVGGILGFKEAGGDLHDLKDMNKMKSAFGGSGGGTPPPPPPGMTPPPPPPAP